MVAPSGLSRFRSTSSVLDLAASTAASPMATLVAPSARAEKTPIGVTPLLLPRGLVAGCRQAAWSPVQSRHGPITRLPPRTACSESKLRPHPARPEALE